jgi:hypothetical protein
MEEHPLVSFGAEEWGFGRAIVLHAFAKVLSYWLSLRYQPCILPSDASAASGKRVDVVAHWLFPSYLFTENARAPLATTIPVFTTGKRPYQKHLRFSNEKHTEESETTALLSCYLPIYATYQIISVALPAGPPVCAG